VVSDNGVDVRGEQDIFGNPWRPVTLTGNALNETAWVGASWNGTAGRRLDLRHLVGTQLARCRAAGVSHPLTT